MEAQLKRGLRMSAVPSRGPSGLLTAQRISHVLRASVQSRIPDKFAQRLQPFAVHVVITSLTPDKLFHKPLFLHWRAFCSTYINSGHQNA